MRVGVSGSEVQSNVTDNESAKIKGPHGVIQGYNGIAVADSKEGIIVAAEAFGVDYEGGVFPEILDRFEESAPIIMQEKREKMPVLLADTNYFSESNLEEAKSRGIDAVIPDPHFRERDERFSSRHKREKKKFDISDFTYDESDGSYICPCGVKLLYRGKTGLRHNRKAKRWSAKQGACAGCAHINSCMSTRSGKNPHKTLYLTEANEAWLSEAMRQRIDTPEGKELYSHRMGIIEPCFANITYCKGMNRFTLRTKRKVNAQWLLYCMVHNIGKCANALEAGTT
jgi:hypothetical protein